MTDSLASDADEPTAESNPEIEAFWDVAKFHALGPERRAVVLRPDAAGVRHATCVVVRSNSGGRRRVGCVGVRDGVKTATASALWDYEAEGESLPEEGEFSIVLDGRGHPAASSRR